MSPRLLADAITSRPLFPSDTQIDCVATNIQNSPIYSETLHHEFKTSIKIKKSIYSHTTSSSVQVSNKPTGTTEYSQFDSQDEEPDPGIQSRLVHHN